MTREEAYRRVVDTIGLMCHRGLTSTPLELYSQTSYPQFAVEWLVGCAEVRLLVSTVLVNGAHRIDLHVSTSVRLMSRITAARSLVRLLADVVDLACAIDAELGAVDLEVA